MVTLVQQSRFALPDSAPGVLIPTGFGLNCEAETAHACRMAGLRPHLVHINDVLAGAVQLSDYGMIVMIGGFAFGDHLGAGKALSIRLMHRLPESLAAFVDEGGLLLGICNGFQTLAKMGLLPRLDGEVEQRVTVTTNDSGRFHDAWVRLRGERESPCIFTRGLDRIDLPVRHGEGKVVISTWAIFDRLLNEGLVPVRYLGPDGEPTEAYPYNPNGSRRAVAGLCDPTGRIFGLMPHPEAYHSPYLHPHWPQQRRAGNLPKEGPGLMIFRNAADYLRNRE
jgi:phosphoribosylformylglycinamidine (FGAM) synthase-like amidotransferase family enzyme